MKRSRQQQVNSPSKRNRGKDEGPSSANVQSKEEVVLTTFQTKPNADRPNIATVLLVGINGVGKQTLAGLLAQDTRSSLDIDIRKCLTLPLAPDEERPRLDFIVFMISMTNQLSLEELQSIRSSLKEIGVSLQFGGSMVLVTHRDKTSLSALSASDVDALSEAYEIPSFFSNLLDEKDGPHTARRILRMVELATNRKGGIPALALRSYDLEVLPKTSLK